MSFVYKTKTVGIMGIRRRHFLLSLLGTGACGVLGTSYIRFFEPGWFEVNYEKLNPHIFQSKTPLKILHLSDFHASHVVPYRLIEKAIDTGLTQSPDFICITGDFISAKIDNPDEYKRILSKLSDFAPTFACIGNHDGGRWAVNAGGYKDRSAIENLLTGSRIHVLFNQKEILDVKDQKIEIVGLGDFWARDLFPEKVMSAKRKENRPVLVLSHNPDSKEQLMDYDWDVMLCGHTHGGQLKIPFTGTTPFAPVRDHRFVEGLHIWENRHLHITRGVGNLHGIRFNCRPQVSVLTASEKMDTTLKEASI